MKELITLNKKFTVSHNQKGRKKIIPQVRVILISHVYISIFMGVSNGWKSHPGYLTLSYITVSSIITETGVLRCSVKVMFLAAPKISKKASRSESY